MWNSIQWRPDPLWPDRVLPAFQFFFFFFSFSILSVVRGKIKLLQVQFIFFCWPFLSISHHLVPLHLRQFHTHIFFNSIFDTLFTHHSHIFFFLPLLFNFQLILSYFHHQIIFHPQSINFLFPFIIKYFFPLGLSNW